MTSPADGPVPANLDSHILCYCTDLTIGEFRKALHEGTWPISGKENTGKLCTGCFGDFLYCQERLKAGRSSL